MAEYKFVDLPSKKVSNDAGVRADAITAELNALAGDGWSVINAVPSIVLGRVGFALSR